MSNLYLAALQGDALVRLEKVSEKTGGVGDLFTAYIPSFSAALLSAAVVLLVFRRTNSVQDDRERRARRAESVAIVIASAAAFSMKSHSTQEKRDALFEAQKQFTNALGMFAAREIADNREVAEWALRAAQDYAAMAGPLMNTAGDDAFEVQMSVQQPIEQAGQVGGVLMRWARDGFPETMDRAPARSMIQF